MVRPLLCFDVKVPDECHRPCFRAGALILNTSIECCQLSKKSKLISFVVSINNIPLILLFIYSFLQTG